MAKLSPQTQAVCLFFLDVSGYVWSSLSVRLIDLRAVTSLFILSVLEFTDHLSFLSSL